MKRKIQWFSIAILGVLVGLLGCSDGLDEPTPDSEPGQTGLELSVDFQGGTDVAGFQFAIRECGQRPIVAGGHKDLEDLVLPGMIPEFENTPFDEGSRHLFSDFFTVLPAGCYDVEVQPVDAHGVPVEECAPAAESDVYVEDGQTTEILLVSQCDGPDGGAIDVIAALNHAPSLNLVEFSKFNLECDAVRVCAQATDPDNDPIVFSWAQLGGPELVDDIAVDTGDTDCDDWYCDYIKKPKPDVYHQGEGQECIDFTLGKAGDYEFQVTVNDLYWDGHKLVPFPDSSASLSFPVYAGDNPEIKCPPYKKDSGDNGFIR